jgi:hypothetical protein
MYIYIHELAKYVVYKLYQFCRENIEILQTVYVCICDYNMHIFIYPYRIFNLQTLSILVTKYINFIMQLSWYVFLYVCNIYINEQHDTHTNLSIFAR